MLKVFLNLLMGMDLESAKRSIFKSYQDSMVYHDQGLDASRMNRFNYLGITSEEELMSCFENALVNKPEGVNYLYNEPFLEDDQRRQKVFETFAQTTPGLIDTLGSQMHITITQDIDNIRRCFNDFKRLQDNGMKIQITEFDMCLGRSDVPRVFGSNADISLERVYQEKNKKISEISSVIRESGVRLSGISYWSLTDGIDCNLERIRSNALANQEINNVNEIPTVCGGLIPTHKKLVRNNELCQMFSNSNQSNVQSGMHM